MPVRNSAELALALVLALCLVLRWPLGSLELEHYVGPDEGEVVENVLEMMKTGYLHQRHPGYPGLHFYIQMLPAAGHLLLASWRGEGDSIAELPRQGFYVAARRTTLLAGWLGAGFLYPVGRRWLGRGLAGLAAALVALSPMPFLVSRAVSPDLMLMLFVVFSLALTLRLLEKPSRRSFALAGVGVGLAAGIKYTGAFLIASFLAAWLLCGEWRSFWKRALLGGAAALGTFMVASPYTWLDPASTFRGLGMHFGYYQAAEGNGAYDLLRLTVASGLGLPAALAALVGSISILARADRRGLVILAVPLTYLLVFSFFERAYSRHAVVVLPYFALLAAHGLSPILSSTRARWLSVLALISVLAVPAWGSFRLAVAVRRVTPADRAAEWIEAHLPAGSRILQDQFTTRVDPLRYRVHRLRVEERVFAGDFDWVLESGYPPGIPNRGLRRVIRFEPRGTLEAGITIYQVPPREALMGITLADGEEEAILRPGELRYFGEGWQEPSGGAFGTFRASDGDSSEIFFVLPPGGVIEKAGLLARFRAAPADPQKAILVQVLINDDPVGDFELSSEKPEEQSIPLPRESLRPGLNRLVLQYDETFRLNRRHRRAALFFYDLKLSRIYLSSGSVSIPSMRSVMPPSRRGG